jgi:hypothetical protein
VLDTAGYVSNASFTVTVTDETPPTITLPATIEATTFRASGVIVDFADELQASDSISQIISVECDPRSSSRFPVGPTTVSCTAFDDYRNEVPASFSVDVSIRVPLNLSENEASSKDPLISVFGEYSCMVWEDFEGDASFTDVFL